MFLAAVLKSGMSLLNAGLFLGHGAGVLCCWGTEGLLSRAVCTPAVRCCGTRSLRDLDTTYLLNPQDTAPRSRAEVLQHAGFRMGLTRKNSSAADQAPPHDVFRVPSSLWTPLTSHQHQAQKPITSLCPQNSEGSSERWLLAPLTSLLPPLPSLRLFFPCFSCCGCSRLRTLTGGRQEDGLPTIRGCPFPPWSSSELGLISRLRGAGGVIPAGPGSPAACCWVGGAAAGLRGSWAVAQAASDPGISSPARSEIL